MGKAPPAGNQAFVHSALGAEDPGPSTDCPGESDPTPYCPFAYCGPSPRSDSAVTSQPQEVQSEGFPPETLGFPRETVSAFPESPVAPLQIHPGLWGPAACLVTWTFEQPPRSQNEPPSSSQWCRTKPASPHDPKAVFRSSENPQQFKAPNVKWGSLNLPTIRAGEEVRSAQNVPGPPHVNCSQPSGRTESPGVVHLRVTESHGI